jgi:hypothetical protein
MLDSSPLIVMSLGAQPTSPALMLSRDGRQSASRKSSGIPYQKHLMVAPVDPSDAPRAIQAAYTASETLA